MGQGTKGLNLISIPTKRDLKDFPSSFLGSGENLFRIFTHKDSAGKARMSWYFSSSGLTTSGRFDLSSPQGSCYFSDLKYGCWQEVFRNSRFISRSDLDRKRLLTATREVSTLKIADLAHLAASHFEVTLDLFAGDDYSQPQSWAEDLAKLGFQGIRALLRHDPSGRAKNVVIFGDSGAYSNVQGWTSTISRLTDNSDLLDDIERMGIHVESIPFDM